MAVADPQLIDMRHRRPAAAGDDLVVGRDRLLGELLGRGRQHRRRRLRHVDGARGLVEILAELAGTAVVHERVEWVVGEGAARNAAQCRRADALRQKAAPIDANAAAVAPSLLHGAVPWRVDLACHQYAAKGSLSPIMPLHFWLRPMAGKFMADLAAGHNEKNTPAVRPGF